MKILFFFFRFDTNASADHGVKCVPLALIFLIRVNCQHQCYTHTQHWIFRNSFIRIWIELNSRATYTVQHRIIVYFFAEWMPHIAVYVPLKPISVCLSVCALFVLCCGWFTCGGTVDRLKKQYCARNLFTLHRQPFVEHLGILVPGHTLAVNLFPQNCTLDRPQNYILHWLIQFSWNLQPKTRYIEEKTMQQ